jgi:acyl-CoA thioester hydrolase
MLTFPIHPSFYDLDFGGVVNNIAYLRWMEDARTRFVDDGPLPLVRLMELRTLPVVRQTTVEYKLPLLVGDRAEMRVSLIEMRRSAWTMKFRFLRERDGAEVVVAQQLCCFVHLDRMRPVGIPEPIRDYIQRTLRSDQ